MSKLHDDTRQQIYNLLQRTGTKNTIKAQLRSNLINLIKNNHKLSDLDRKEKSILDRFTDQIIGFGLEYENCLFGFL